MGTVNDAPSLFQTIARGFQAASRKQSEGLNGSPRSPQPPCVYRFPSYQPQKDDSSVNP